MSEENKKDEELNEAQLEEVAGGSFSLGATANPFEPKQTYEQGGVNAEDNWNQVISKKP